MTKTISNIVFSLYVSVGLLAFDLAIGAENSYINTASCGKTVFTFNESQVAWCKAAAYCAGSLDEVLVCACQEDPESSVTRFKINSGTVLIKEFELEISSLFFAKESLHLDTFGHDSNGNKVYLFSFLENVSNGMGVEYWKTAAISSQYATPFVDVHEYGSMSFAENVAQNEDGCNTSVHECKLLVSRWIEGYEKGRGIGLYLAGVWFRLYSGSEPELSVDYREPALTRRYLYDFELARNSDIFKNARSKWYKSRKAHPVEGPYPFFK